jgi:hypothetical protein
MIRGAEIPAPFRLVVSMCRRSSARQRALTSLEPTPEFAAGATGGGPDTGLRAVAALRALTDQLEITDQLETTQVDNARRLGWSWQDIATRLGDRAPQARPQEHGAMRARSCADTV